MIIVGCIVIDSFVRVAAGSVDRSFIRPISKLTAPSGLIDGTQNMKKLADKHGFCLDNKEYKANPTKYNGNLAAFCNLVRYAFTGKTNTPDLHAICCVLGKKELFNRLDVLKKRLLNK